MTAAAEAKQITAGCVTTTARFVQPRACTRMLNTVCRKGWPPRMQHVTYLYGKMRCRRCSQLPQSRHPIGNHLYGSSNSTSTESDLQVGGGDGRPLSPHLLQAVTDAYTAASSNQPGPGATCK
jgi:hypothetical protein